MKIFYRPPKKNQAQKNFKKIVIWTAIKKNYKIKIKICLKMASPTLKNK